MFRFLRKLFGARPIGSGNTTPADRDDFLRQLADSDIFVFAAMDDDGIDPDTMTQEQLLAEIERKAMDLSEDKHREPLAYEADGVRRLPFFTTQKLAETFVGEWCREHDRVYGFQILGIKGALLGRLLPACDVLVMNDKTEDEVVFTQEDMAAVARILPSTD